MNTPVTACTYSSPQNFAQADSIKLFQVCAFQADSIKTNFFQACRLQVTEILSLATLKTQTGGAGLVFGLALTEETIFCRPNIVQL
jgi:hypothetical protein